jgi:hypothetical protein
MRHLLSNHIEPLCLALNYVRGVGIHALRHLSKLLSYVGNCRGWATRAFIVIVHAVDRNAGAGPWQEVWSGGVKCPT